MNAFEGNLLNKPKPNQINKPRNTSVGNPSTLYAQPQYTQPKSGWYAGDQPTASETIAQIYKVGKDNPDVLSQLNDMFNAEIMNPESNLYQPYLMPTTDNVTDTSIRNTNNATNEWNQLQAELAYWANRTDRNYSDDEIINRIDMTKYPTLAKMDEYKTTGVTMDLLAPVGYSRDAMYGVLWSARNGGQTSGNYLVDAAQGILGNGNKYKRDEALYGRRDATSDNYAPYTVGATALDDLAYKYGMQGDFTEEWLNGEGRALLNGDAQARADYNRIYNTVMNTKKLNEEAALFNEYVQKAIDSGVDPAEFFTDEFESDMKEDYPELYKALEGQRSGKLYETSGAVGFDYNKAQRDMKANWDRINGNVTPDQMDAAMSAEFGLPENNDEAQEAIEQQVAERMKTAAGLTWAYATTDERTTLGTDPAQFASSKATGSKMLAVAGSATDAPHRTAMNAANAYAGEYYLNARKLHDGLVSEFYGNDAMRSLLETYFPEHAANGTVPSLNEFVALEESNEEFSTAVFQAGKFFGDVGEKLKQLDNEKKILKGVDERYKLAEELGQGGSARDFLNFVYQFDGYEAQPMLSVAVWSPKQYKQNSELIAMFEDYISKAEELKVPAEYVDGLRAAVGELQTNNYLMEASKLKYVGDFGEKVKEFDETQTPYYKNLPFISFDAPSADEIIHAAIIDPYGLVEFNEETVTSVAIAQKMTENEKNTYKYIFVTDGPEAAKEYYDNLEPSLHYRKYNELYDEASGDFENAGEAIVKNVESVLMNSVSGFNVLARAIRELSGEKISQYDPINWSTMQSQQIRESSKRQINEQLGEGSFAASLATFGYDAGMASLDSVTSALLGGGSTGGLVLMGGAAMDNALMDAEMRGAEGVQKWVYAGAVAAAEVITEKLPMDALTDAWKAGGTKGVKEFFAGALKQLGKGFITDAPGEALSEFFGEMADQIIMDEMANYEARIAQLVNEEGLSPEEAQLVADREVISNMLYAFALGGVSAGGSNVAAYTVGSVFGGNENEDGGSETKPTEEQPANEQKPKNKWVAAAEEMAEAETAEESATEQTDEAPVEVPEAVQNDPVKSAEAVLAKAESLGTGTTESAGLIASVMEGVAGMDSMEADAAARTIAAKWKDPLFTTRRMIRNSPDAARTLHAMELAALVPDSQTAEAINTMVESGEVTPEAVDIVNTVYEQEMADNGLRERLDAKIASMATAETTVGLLAQSDLESIKQLDADAAAAKAQMEKAQAEYDSLSERMNADMAALDSARDAFYANLADETVKNKYLQVYERYRQDSDKMFLANDNLAAAQKNHADAKAKAETGRTELLNSARVEAKAQVAQRMEQRRAELEALAQQEAQAAETKRQNDNVLALQADDFVNTYYANAPAEIKAKIREQYMAYKGETKNVTRDMTQFASQISKKFKLKITFTDSHGIFEGAYMGGNRIVLDKNATQGDLIKAVLTHEIVHAAETSNEYNEFADAVLDAYYQGNTEQMQKDIDAEEAKYSEQAGQKGVGRSELVAKRLSNLLNDNPKALDRLIAEKPNVAMRIWQSIKDFIAKMTGVHDKALDTAIQLEKKLEKALGGRLTAANNTSFAFEGYTKDGKRVYSSSFPEGSTKEIRAARILQLIKDVWSKSPIELEIERNGRKEIIVAHFDPYIPEDGTTPSDATKLAAGNRKGNSSDRKTSQKLADDIPDIIRTSRYDHSKQETGGKNEAHNGVNVWHYFTNEIGFINDDGSYADYDISIDVKEKNDGDFVYAFAARRKKGSERTEAPDLFSDPETLNAPVNGMTPIIANGIVADPNSKVNLSIPSENGEPSAEIIRGGATKFSLASWTEKEKSDVRKTLIQNGFGPANVDSWIDNVNSVAAIIAGDKARLDYTADPDQVMLKNNQEYVKTLDASTLCAKRLLYQGTFNEIQHQLPNTVITSDMLLDLLNLMKEEGYETPCGVCYVESRRRHLGKFAEQWLNGRPESKGQKAWEPYNGEYIPTLDELTTTDGLANLKKEHPETYNDFMKKMASLGSSNPKIVELRTDYRGDIRKITRSQRDKIEKIGGLRVQSFSDFETPHLIDMMQAVLDMAGKNLTSQAYTKVPNFAWVFGDTGIKINLSLLAEGNGLDADGNLIFSSSEGMDFNEAMKLRDRYPENVGTIIVGANDAHIRAAMADPRIDYIIPFHRSGWGQNELNKVGVLNTYTDYQAYQNERMLDGSKPEGGNYYPIDYWDYNKTGDENAETYLRMCEADGRIPKFEQFLTKDSDGHWIAPSGYWKMLIDFKMYDNDGVGVPQKAVQPNFNMDEAVRVLNEYEGGADTLPVAHDIVDKFVSEYKANNEGVRFSLPSTDILNDQIARHQAEQNAPQQDFGTGERQFVAKTLPGNPNIPQWAVEGMQNNPEARYYEKDTNRAQLIRAWQRIQENGVEAERERLVNLEGYSADDTAEANLLMAMALREDTSDPATFFQLAFTYDVEGTDTAQSFQARKMFSKMTPDGARIWAAGKSEQATAGYLDSHKPYRENLDQRANDVADSIRDKQSGNELLRLTSGGDFTIDSSNNKWGVPLNEQQLALIEHYGLQNEARPGIFYNRATIKQRMLEAIIATHNPLEVTNLGLNLIHRLEMMKDGKAVATMADLNYIGERLGEFMGLGQDAGGRAADVALARAYEAFGNITPASGWEKFRTQRYVNMLLSVPTFTRNIMGNAFQNALNAASHGIAVELDKKAAKKTGRRTLEHLSVEERVNGWKAFAEETKNTFKDFFIDKVDAAPNKEKYSTNRKGRTFQNNVQEGMRNLESFMMSVGDRNVWKKAFVNSMAEQQKLADRGLLFNDNGTTRTHEQMVEKAEEAANFATFTEDGFVQKVIGYANQLNPRLGDVLSIYQPFTGVPTNIMKRSMQYSPMGLLWAVGKRGYQHVTKQNFDQQKFVEGVARGLTGTGMLVVGALLGAAGFIRMGTEDDESNKVYDANTAMGNQYTPYVYDPTTDTYVSLSTFAPAVSPLVWGASVAEALKGKEPLLNIFINALSSSTDSILDASYLSSISDIFGGYGSITENIVDVGLENIASQMIPALLTQTANALDPYVRETKDKDKLVELMKKTVNKIPGLRNVVLPEKVTVAGENVLTKPGASNYVDPFTRTNPSRNEALIEAMRLYEVLGTTDVLPSDALRSRTNSFSLKLDKVQWTVTLNDEQKEEYKKYYGDLWTSRVSELMSDFHYQQLDDKQKGAKIKKILQDCLKEAKTEFLKRYGHKVEE